MTARRSTALGAALVTLAFVGVAFGAIPGANGTIQGCYGKVTGNLRVIDAAKGEKCSNLLERPLVWSQQGPKGDKGDTGTQGIQGPQGAPGAPGPPGPAASSVLTSFTYVPSYAFAGPNFEKVLSRSLAEGTYFFTATVELRASEFTNDGVWDARCELRDGATVLSGTGASLQFSGTGTQFGTIDLNGQTLPLAGSRSVPAGGTEISIWCSNAGSPDGRMSGAQLMILKVAGSF